MRPVGVAGADALPAIPRKPSFAAPTPTNPRNNVPTSFFLARESDIEAQAESHRPEEPQTNPLCTLEEVIGGVSATSDREEDTRRRRSTIKPHIDSIRSVSAQSNVASEPSLTPSLIASPESLPSSPKSAASRSLRNAEIGSITDDTTSQAMLSSGEEDNDAESEVQNSAPQLIMPSIRMPSRRPFTDKGRDLGRLKIMVAGSKGSGKTSLIKSIVQTCEDIVHVDPLGPSLGTPSTSTGFQKHRHSMPIEIYASTKPYPSWWSEVDESRILRRRKSLGDSVLERNICFVDTPAAKSCENLIRYMEQQLQTTLNASVANGSTLVNLMSGNGGPQVDVVLYLTTRGSIVEDLEIIKQLSELSNVIPLIAKSDILGDEQVSQLRDEINASLGSRTVRAFAFPPVDTDEATELPPFPVSAALSPDTETMDASVLMSSEYIQPLQSSQLSYVVNKIFDKETISYLRHSAAKKLISWSNKHTFPIDVPNPSPSASPRPSSIGSPVMTSTSASGVLIPYASDISLTTSNSYTLARLTDHTHREERLAQVRLAKWATDLHESLNRERMRYEKLARSERAVWLVEKMGEEVRDGRLQSLGKSPSRIRQEDYDLHAYANTAFAINDPMGLLKWNDDIRTRGWVALQVVGSFGVIGGLALWLARTWGLNSPAHSITEQLKW